MTNIRPFQIILLGSFGALAILSLIFFMVYGGSSSDKENPYGDGVVIWGTLDEASFDRVFAEVVKDNKNFQTVQYIEKDARTFDFEFVNAIAEGRSPDLIVLPSDSIVRHREKLLAISYDTLPARTFRDRYVDGAEIFLFTDGVYGVPFGVDPLVMYWNRDMFSGNGLASPPTTWAQLQDTVVPALTRTTGSFDITQSAVAFGEYANIRNVKGILSLLFLQSGTDIVSEDNRRYVITLRQEGGGLLPADTALSFYTRFALPSAPQYSWNRSLPQDRSQFISGKLGLYFGFGSEYQQIESSNPNLNFDIAEVPQDASATIKRNFGKFYAFAIPRASGNIAGAYAVAESLASANASAMLTEQLGLSPVLRNAIMSGATDPYRQTLFSAALISRAWLDPNPEESLNVFKLMVEDVTSGRSRVSEAVNDAVGRLKLLFQ